MHIAELRQACFSANSAEQIDEAFQKWEDLGLDNVKVGFTCWELATDFYEQNHKPENIVWLCLKGTDIFTEIMRNCSNTSIFYKCSLVSARFKQLIGFLCHRLHRFDQSTIFLYLAGDILMDCLGKETDTSCSDDVVYDILSAVHFELFRVKRAIGILDDAGYHLRKGLEMCRGKCSDEIGMANEQVADDYIKAKNFAEALSFYWKAEEIYMKQLMPDSVLLMDVRRNIALLYVNLGENEKALAVSRLGLSLSNGMDSSVALIDAKLLNADILMRLDRFEEAFEGYKAVIPHALTLGEEGARASALTSMARARYNQERFSEAKKYIRFAFWIVMKKERDSNKDFLLLEQMSSLYEQMDEFDCAISLASRLLDIPNLPENFLVDYSDRLFKMINKSDNEKHVKVIIKLSRKLIHELSPHHFLVAHCYVGCGALYSNFGEPDKAALYLVAAKSMMNRCVRPDKPGSLEMAHALSLSYAAMGSYSLAIECEEKVVEVLELAPSHQDSLVEALEMLNKYKQKASGEGKSSASCSKIHL